MTNSLLNFFFVIKRMIYQIFQVYSNNTNETFISYTIRDNLPKVLSSLNSRHVQYINNYAYTPKYQNYFRILESCDYHIRFIEELELDDLRLVKKRVNYWIRKTPYSFGKN